MKKLISFLLILSFATHIRARPTNEFIGQKFTNYLKAFPVNESLSFGSSQLNSVKGLSGYTFTNMTLKDGRSIMLLSQILSVKPKSEEIVVDAFSYKVPKNTIIVGQLGFCSYGNNIRKAQANYEPIVALVKDEDVDVYSHVIKAWKINIKTKKFEEIPAKGIICQNGSYGV